MHKTVESVANPESSILPSTFASQSLCYVGRLATIWIDKHRMSLVIPSFLRISRSKEVKAFKTMKSSKQFFCNAEISLKPYLYSKDSVQLKAVAWTYRSLHFTRFRFISICRPFMQAGRHRSACAIAQTDRVFIACIYCTLHFHAMPTSFKVIACFDILLPFSLE